MTWWAREAKFFAKPQCLRESTCVLPKLSSFKPNKIPTCSSQITWVARKDISLITCSTGFHSVLFSLGRLLKRQLLFYSSWYLSYPKKILCACFSHGLAHSQCWPFSIDSNPQPTDHPHIVGRARKWEGTAVSNYCNNNRTAALSFCWSSFQKQYFITKLLKHEQ